MDYLKELGINGIYFCPITEASSNHRYDTIDYMKIDKYLGDEKVFKNLVKEAHKREMKVMLDAVFNHIGYYSNKWQDVVENKEKSIYKDWFYISNIENVNIPVEMITKDNLAYETFAFSPYMPKLNTENPEVVEHLINVGKYWVEKFDIDAWRLDVANEVDHVFWRKFRDEIKRIKPGVYILGEIWHNSLPWLMGDQFDAVMNYPLSDAINQFFCEDKINASEFKYRLNDVIVSYKKQMNEVAFNLLDSHDTTRILSLAKNNKDKFKLAYLFMFTQGGSPCIYYGDEIGIDGIHGNGVEMHRKCMVWNEDKQDRDMFKFIQKLIKLRMENKSLRIVDNEWIKTDDITKTVILKKDDITIIINNNDKEIDLELPSYLRNQIVLDLFEDREVELKDKINMKQFGYILLKIKN